MKIIIISCLYSNPVFSQPLTVEEIRTDIDSAISVPSDIHPTFNGSADKKALLALRDNIYRE